MLDLDQEELAKALFLATYGEEWTVQWRQSKQLQSGYYLHFMQQAEKLAKIAARVKTGAL